MQEKCIILNPNKLARCANIYDIAEFAAAGVDSLLRFQKLNNKVHALYIDECPEDEINRTFYDEKGNKISILYGNVLICNILADGQMRSLSNDEYEKYLSEYKYPEMFARTPGGYLYGVRIKIGE